MILNRNFLFIIGLFFLLNCTGSRLPADENSGRAPGGSETGFRATAPQQVFMVRNQSDQQVRWQYPDGKKEIITPGRCLHYRGFSLPYGIYIHAGGQKICGSNQGNNVCKLMNSSGDASDDICGEGGGDYLCPAGGSFDITNDLVLKENGRTVSAEDFNSSSSSCPMLGERENPVTPIRQN